MLLRTFERDDISIVEERTTVDAEPVHNVAGRADLLLGTERHGRQEEHFAIAEAARTRRGAAARTHSERRAAPLA